jgi:hypothetical protein
MPIFPISFSMPPEKIVKSVPSKNRVLAHIIPGNRSTYIYKTEDSYYQSYKDSLFGLTMKKSGWDCMRHYEILANGCIPLFQDLEKIPPNTMNNFPREIIEKTNALYFELVSRPMGKKDTIFLQQSIEKLIEYTKTHLTTTVAAQNILKHIDAVSAKHILYLSEDLDPDYMRCLTLSGFKNLLGTECHDYPKIPHIYDDFKGDCLNLYGNGFTYSKNVKKEYHNYEYDKTVVDDIINHRYDIVIYGSYHRGIPFFELVDKHYKKNEIVFICGEDCDENNNRSYHNCELKHKYRDYNLFIREQ